MSAVSTTKIISTQPISRRCWQIQVVGDMMSCASCGVAEADHKHKLKKCTACNLVRYCGVKCQKEHWQEHKRECKKRAAELHDEVLFKQPNGSCFGYCPICCLPLPLDGGKSIVMSCCSKRICDCCTYANQKREMKMSLTQRCPFCILPGTVAK
mmetsp:Transcript_11949/g.17145  ORF Transcript_11949/g.17145 Transcript_11949/m.17145 type:complete len:154 (-) Transcript_11949:650-1111(-)